GRLVLATGLCRQLRGNADVHRQEWSCRRRSDASRSPSPYALKATPMTDGIKKIVENHGLEKIVTPRGPANSMTDLTPASMQVDGFGAGQGPDWMGPLNPLRPIAPPDVAGRALDFPVGFNLNTTARPYEPITFEDLRRLADSYDPLRIVI